MYTQTKPSEHHHSAHLQPDNSTNLTLRPDAKEIIWNALRGKRLSQISFRRDHVMGSVTADFFSPAFHLVVGINEPGVSSKHWFYAKQDSQLRHMGFRTLRFTYEEVTRELPVVLDSIVEVVSQIARRQKRI